MLKPTSLINASTDNNHNHLPNYLHPDSLELHNKSAVLSARRKVVGQLNTHRRNVINQETGSRTGSVDALISMLNNILLNMREKTTAKTLNLLTKPLKLL